ncbi:MAG: exodeoxyribonuclease VII small subunit [Coriobacteriales bacterium]|nr:exodeoxyribonuclease VII small subunit [Coriobacteriales bacterium]
MVALRPVDQMSFRELMRELDECVRALESDSLELEASMERYERGVQLLRAARGRLDEAQQRVTCLMGQLEAESTDDIDNRLS